MFVLRVANPVTPAVLFVQHAGKLGGVLWVKLVQAKAMKFGVMDIVDLPEATVRGAVFVVRVKSVGV